MRGMPEIIAVLRMRFTIHFDARCAFGEDHASYRQLHLRLIHQFAVKSFSVVVFLWRAESDNAGVVPIA